MSSLEKLFDELLINLSQPGSLNPAVSDPVFYYVYPPDKILEIKKAIPRWTARLENSGFLVKRISLPEIMWKTVERSGRWEEWLEIEQYAEQHEINEAVRDTLRGDQLINALQVEMETVTDNTVILLTEAELLHPYYRTQFIENRLHDNVTAPVVIFYPGTRTGQYGLKFLGFHSEDGNYRSVLLGGL